MLQRVAALAPALLLLAYLPAQLMLRCRMDGLLREACCCSPSSEDQSSGREATAKAQDDCCERQLAQQQRPQAEAANPTLRDVTPPATLTVLASVFAAKAPTIDGFDRAAQRHGPAREGPRIVLLKSAFLI